MGRSTVEKLPPEIRVRVEDWLREFLAGRITLDMVMERLDGQFADQLGDDMPSRSAVGRHAQKFQKLNERLRQSREMAELLVAEAGPDIADGKAFQVLVQGFQSLAFDMMAKLEDGQTLDPENLMFLARSLKDVTSARKTDADLHARLKADAAKEAAAAVDRVAARTKGAGGLTAETIDAIKSEILGVRK